MDLVPVSDESEDEQHKGNQEQPSGFRGIHRMAMVTMLGLVVGQRSGHADIVDAWGSQCEVFG
jgi:hypothetical protein